MKKYHEDIPIFVIAFQQIAFKLRPVKVTMAKKRLNSCLIKK